MFEPLNSVGSFEKLASDIGICQSRNVVVQQDRYSFQNALFWEGGWLSGLSSGFKTRSCHGTAYISSCYKRVEQSAVGVIAEPQITDNQVSCTCEVLIGGSAPEIYFKMYKCSIYFKNPSHNSHEKPRWQRVRISNFAQFL